MINISPFSKILIHVPPVSSASVLSSGNSTHVILSFSSSSFRGWRHQVHPKSLKSQALSGKPKSQKRRREGDMQKSVLFLLPQSETIRRRKQDYNSFWFPRVCGVGRKGDLNARLIFTNRAITEEDEGPYGCEWKTRICANDETGGKGVSQKRSYGKACVCVCTYVYLRANQEGETGVSARFPPQVCGRDRERIKL